MENPAMAIYYLFFIYDKNLNHIEDKKIKVWNKARTQESFSFSSRLCILFFVAISVVTNNCNGFNLFVFAKEKLSLHISSYFSTYGRECKD